MNLLLKQRLVGAAVIIALGVVIIPMLLDGSGSRVIQDIPPRPERQGVSGEGLIKNDAIPRLPKKSEGEVIYEMEPTSEQQKSPVIASQDSTKTNTEEMVLPKEADVVKARVNRTDVSNVIKTDAIKTDVINTDINKAGVSKTSTKETSVANVIVGEGQVIKSPVSSKTSSIQKLASWVVQVGSFTEKSKAITLRDQLRQKGFTSFMEPLKSSQGKEMYRVRVGPVQYRSQAEEILGQLKQKAKLEKAYVTPN